MVQDFDEKSPSYLFKPLSKRLICMVPRPAHYRVEYLYISKIQRAGSYESISDIEIVDGDRSIPVLVYLEEAGGFLIKI